MQDAIQEMKDMLLAKNTSTDSPKQRRYARGKKGRRDSALDSVPSDSVKPRRLDFDEEAANEDDEPELEASMGPSDDEGATPAPSSKKEVTDSDLGMGTKDTEEHQDEDLFQGPFARAKKRAPRRTESGHLSTSAKKAKKSPVKKAASDPASKLEEDMRQDEVDLKNDEIMKLLDKIRENRLVAIIPLDCNAILVCITCAVTPCH